MKYYTIYETVNKVNGQNYIGKHITDNPNDNYLGSGKYLKRAIKKYGIENFEKTVLHIFDNVKDMNDKEAELIDNEYLKFCKTYNLKRGGDGGFDYINENKLCPLNKELRTKGGLTSKKRFEDEPEYRKKVLDTFKIWNESNDPEVKKKKKVIAGNAFRNRCHTKETKIKIGQKNSIYQKGDRNSQYGTCWIYNDNESIKIKRETLDLYLQQGWIKGRKIKYTPVA